MTAPSKASDLVLLAPGFLGFDRLGSFYYFGDRVSSVLRGHLEAVLEQPAPVIALALGASDGLLQRQRTLVRAISELAARFTGLERIHLVGHSSGGVDAELLLAAQTIDGAAWPAAFTPWRGLIASVTTIAAPHYGTTLALADVSRLLEQPLTNITCLGAAFPALFAFAGVLPDRVAAKYQLLGDPGALKAFLGQLWKDRTLLLDLRPERMEALRQKHPRALSHVQVTCYATGAIANPAPTQERFEQPDSLFLYLANQTAGAYVDEVSPEVQRNIDALNAEGVHVIASATEAPRPKHRFDAVDNDAVVNTARQLLPDSTLGGIVYGDHADVIGHYDRRDPLRPEQFIREGVFRSGARFGDDEFFTLYREVARDIVRAARPARMLTRIGPTGVAAQARARLASVELSSHK